MLKNKISKFLNIRRINLLRKKGIKIGKNCSIDKTAIFGTEPYLISIGDNVRITHNVQFITHDGGIWVLRNLHEVDKSADKMGPIKIGNNVNIGWNVILMPGVKIGDNVVIGIGSIVTKDVPSNSVVAGVPAKIIETIDEYSNKVKKHSLNTKDMNSKDKKNYLLSIFGDEKNV